MKLNGMVAKAIKSERDYLAEKAKDFAFARKCVSKFDESLFPEKTTIYMSAGSVTIRVPWGLDNLTAARKAMGKGWEYTSSYTSTEGTLTKSYRLNSEDKVTYGWPTHVCYLNLVMDATELDPNSCKRIEVGEKTYTQKVYQVICEDGIKEILGAAEAME